MKKVLKYISMLFCLISIFLVSFPGKIDAVNVPSGYYSVNETYDLSKGDILINDVKFVNQKNTTYKAYGLKGKVFSLNDEIIELSIIVKYYDENLNYLIESKYKQDIPTSKEYDYIQMIESDLGDSVAYYTIELSTKVPTLIDSTPSHYREYSHLDYVIDAYDVNIKVNEDNSFEIIEKITTYYNVQKHGIYREIPLKNTVIRADGSTSKTTATISDVSVNAEYDTSKSDGYYTIKIGSADKYVQGQQTYTIKYTYDLGEELNEGYDEFYFNIIGDHWDTVIGNVKFTITMPKEFDSSRLGFVSSARGDIKYLVNGNVITGSFSNILESESALTVRLELEDGYFHYNPIKDIILLVVMYALPIILLLVSVYIWFKHGKDDVVIETVEFYPPENMNSLEVGYSYKGEADSKDVTSLLVYLASKGYLKIKETKKGRRNSFEIEKTKEYDGKNFYEKWFFDSIFTKVNKKEAEHEIVTEDELESKFYISVDSILANVNSTKAKKLFDKEAEKKSFLLIVLAFVASLAVLIPSLIKIQTPVVAIVFSAFSFGMIMLAKWMNSSNTKTSGGNIKSSKMIIYIFAAAFYILPTIGIFSTMIQKKFIPPFILGHLCIVGIFVVVFLMPKRTQYGNKILGKIRGFKRFLETAEKAKLEALVEENPTYFYDILPYTYVLGVSDKWIKKFESIAISPPQWYASYDPFDCRSLTRFNRTLNSATTTMASRPISTSSGGFSGGGFSGGGFSGGGFSGGGSGGGGGGSW